MTASKAFPLPWSFTWEDAPRILDAEGKVVVVLATGTIEGPYSSSDVETLANTIIQAVGLQVSVQDGPQDEEDLCDCGKPFPDNGRCDFCGAHARYLKEAPSKPLFLQTRRPSKPEKRK